MKQSQLLKMLDFFDENNVWIFYIHTVYTYFDKESKHTIKTALARHVKNGILQRVAKGLFVNPRAKTNPSNKLEAIATMLRHEFTIYLSFESVLSDNGVISQIPNRLTFMSKNKSQTFHTPYGTIEFTKTNRVFDLLDKDFYFDEDRKIYIARVEKALDDAYRHNRSINLIEGQYKKELRHEKNRRKINLG